MKIIEARLNQANGLARGAGDRHWSGRPIRIINRASKRR